MAQIYKINCLTIEIETEGDSIRQHGQSTACQDKTDMIPALMVPDCLTFRRLGSYKHTSVRTTQRLWVYSCQTKRKKKKNNWEIYCCRKPFVCVCLSVVSVYCFCLFCQVIVSCYVGLSLYLTPPPPPPPLFLFLLLHMFWHKTTNVTTRSNPPVISNDIEHKHNSKIIKGHNSVEKFGKISCVSHNTAYTKFEPPHDKTNNVAVRPAKTQVSLGTRPA